MATADIIPPLEHMQMALSPLCVSLSVLFLPFEPF